MKQTFVYRMVFKDIYWLIFLTNVQYYFYYTLLLRDIYCILTSASIHLYHVRLSYVIKEFTYLLTNCCSLGIQHSVIVNFNQYSVPQVDRVT